MTDAQERAVRLRAKQLERFLIERGVFQEFTKGFVREEEAADIFSGKRP